MTRHRMLPLLAGFLLALCIGALPQSALAKPDAPPYAPRDASVDSMASTVLPSVADDDSASTHPPVPVDVRGVVRDANGSPIRGASIRLMSETDTVRVQSDGSGRFRARLTVARGVFVQVRAYGYRDLVRTYRPIGRAIEAALALPPPYPLGGVTVSGVEPSALDRDRVFVTDVTEVTESVATPV